MDGGLSLVLFIASILISAALTPRIQPPQPEAFADIEFPQFEDGTPQAVAFGDVWSDDWMVLAVGSYRTEGIESESGKK